MAKTKAKAKTSVIKAPAKVPLKSIAKKVVKSVTKVTPAVKVPLKPVAKASPAKAPAIKAVVTAPVKVPAKTASKSAKTESRQVEFEIYSPVSNVVEIAGTFNDWTPSKLSLKKDKNGIWKGKVSIAPGRYEYKVVFDGSSWELDPRRESVATNLGANNLLIVE